MKLPKMRIMKAAAAVSRNESEVAAKRAGTWRLPTERVDTGHLTAPFSSFH